MDEKFKIVHSIKFYRDFANHNVRPDGREFDQFRPVRVTANSIGTADGSAIVKIGHTTVVCGIKAELAQPTVTEPDAGFIVPNIDLSAVSLYRSRANMVNDAALALSSQLNDIIINSEWVDLKALCIAKEKLVWVLHCDITCLDYDGSVLDAAVMALVTALRNLTLPEISYDLETGNFNVLETRKAPQFLKHAPPVAVTFAVFDEKALLVDPNAQEEELSSTIFTQALCDGKICLIHKTGGSTMAPKQLADCIDYVNKRSKSIADLIDTILKK